MLIVIICLIILFLLIAYVIATYNQFIKLDNSTKEAFSTMDVYLKKRADLIPNLVETVKGYGKYEQETLSKIISLRNNCYGNVPFNEKSENNNALSRELGKLIAVAENYPDLKANTTYLALTDQLKSVENDIANARKYYNAVVRTFNNKIMVFPNNIIANIFNYSKQQLFEIDSEDRENVQVKF